METIWYLLNDSIKKKIVMELKIDDKKIRELIVEKDENTLIKYKLNDGMIVDTVVYDIDAKKDANVLSDSEMIDRVKKSEFMDELNKARRKYKISKEISDTFPEKDDDGNVKTPGMKTSDESLDIIKEIIDKDKDGTLDEIARRNTMKVEPVIKNMDYDDYNGKEFDLGKCNESIRKIEEKIMNMIRNSEGTSITESKVFNDVLDDYRDYCTKRNKLSDEVWNSHTTKTTD